MITEREVTATYLSPTKKDFYQIWNELLDTAQKLSVNWDPTSTNESDPGIVLLKVLTGVADKLNYSIDKNILEQFMPSATQEESMRKLCDMLGYNIKYYQSATTDVSVSYIESLPESGTDIVVLPKFSNITNEDGTINYVTLKDATFSLTSGTDTVCITTCSIPCIEGTYRECETDNNNIISINHIDNNKRYYLPESAIAENGIYIYNYYDEKNTSGTTNFTEEWERVENLNTQISGAHVWKLGFDSRKKMPYIQFPDDISSLIEDGLLISYISTSGANGNISARALTTVKGTLSSSNESTSYSSDQFTAINPSAAFNGANIETIDDTYTNFKKIIGTFDTLITCRDYMNIIYRLFTDDNIPLVSNVIVSDIRDDINRSVTLCSFDDYGICYIDKAITEEVIKKDKKGTTYTVDEAKINNFDLVLYPFKTVYGAGSKDEYISSFTYTEENANEIESGIKDYKTISHNITYPEKTEIACIKNYLKLRAKITPTRKINTAEELLILNNIYANIYKHFNMRKLEFGEELVEDVIATVIKESDTRIKNVYLDTPEIYTKFMLADNSEHDLTTKTGERFLGKEAYNKLALRNILAGRIALFDYNTKFKPSYTEENYSDYNPQYPEASKAETEPLVKMTSECLISATVLPDAGGVTLNNNETISFRAPNFKTTITYPGYVNYYAKLKNSTESILAVAARFISLYNYFTERSTPLTNITDSTMYEAYSEAKYSAESPAIRYNYANNTLTKNETGNYVIKLDSYSFIAWANWFKNQQGPGSQYYTTIYKIISSSLDNSAGLMIDNSNNKYRSCTQWSSMSLSDGNTALKNYYVPEFEENDNLPEDKGTKPYYTKDGLGRDAVYVGVVANSEYMLTGDERLYINYTESSSTDSSTDSDTVITKVYEAGTIIKPNFELINSEEYHISHSYTKDASKLIFQTSTGSVKLDGMFTLATTEQIEIREQVKIELSDSVVYVYWTLDENKHKDTSVFPFTDKKYTLQENEYFYYTDANKLDMAYYGYGTEIEYHGTSIELKKNKNEVAVTAADIAENGLTAIPWVKCNFWKSTGSTTDNYLSVNEYQYINLTSGDKLTKIGTSERQTIDNTWQKCSNVEYMLSDSSAVATLPEFKVPEISWEIRSQLEFNMGPALEQTIYAEKYNGNYLKKDSITLWTYVNPELRDKPTYKQFKTITPTLDNTPLSLKSNYLCQSGSDSVDVRITTYDNNGEILEHVDDFAIHVYKQNELRIQGSGSTATLITEHNFGDHWTKISAEELGTGYLPLRFAPPSENDYALCMIYYIDQTNTASSNYAKLVGESGKPLTIFNNGSWWSGYKTGNTYHLKPGISVVRVDKSTTVKLYADASQSSIIILSDLDYITKTDNNEGLNLDVLDYQNIDQDSAAKQLLADIKKIDPEFNFYYNCILDNSTELDINVDDEEKLSTPSVFYDYNNVNNKFVISEISVTDMINGISITKPSKI